ncbi:hypothetical protein ACFWGN_16080 [Oerskovia sp. NPDC060338]|uniref:hypothetical protein n=1 Tax=Oerskovia sp. NPDC060338 TaxID=3347100 RepID=UPI00364F7984
MAGINAISLPPASPPPAAPPRINAHASLWRIVDTLAASGWGDLREAPQAVRSYLLAIAQLADQKSGIAEVTDAQAAERAGISRRSVMRARHWLQDQGLVVMIRRGARQGLRGVASVLSVTKTALVALLPGARTAKDGRARRRAETPGGARRLIPNVTARRPFPSSGRKTAATATRGVRHGLSALQAELSSITERRSVIEPDDVASDETPTRPQVAPRAVQEELRALAQQAAANPVQASTLAQIRADLQARSEARKARR